MTCNAKTGSSPPPEKPEHHENWELQALRPHMEQD